MKKLISNYEVFESNSFAKDFAKDLKKYFEERHFKSVIVTSIVFGENEMSVTVSTDKGKAGFLLGSIKDVQSKVLDYKTQIIDEFEENVGK